MTTTDDLIADLSRLCQTATTSRRDVAPEDWLWFFDHPLRKALAARGINTVGVAAAAVIEWLEDVVRRDEAEEVHYFDDHKRGHRHALNSSCYETCPGYREKS